MPRDDHDYVPHEQVWKHPHDWLDGMRKRLGVPVPQRDDDLREQGRFDD